MPSSTFGTSKPRVSTLLSSPTLFPPDPTLLARRVSARIPQTTAVSPRRTTALPDAWVKEPVCFCGARNWEGRRPLGRWMGVFGVLGWRWARRKGCGESLAKVARGKDSEGGESAGLGGIGVAIGYLDEGTAGWWRFLISESEKLLCEHPNFSDTF